MRWIGTDTIVFDDPEEVKLPDDGWTWVEVTTFDDDAAGCRVFIRGIHE